MGSGVRWLLLNYLQTWLDDTVVITFDTDIPVHAWLCHSTTPPNMHLLTKTVRGLRVMGDPYFCFPKQDCFEQDEPGDTLTHTFTWPGWYHCLTQYFFFKATAGGEPTPTQWGIFHKHYTAPETVTLLVYGNGTYTDIPFPTDPAIHWNMVHSADAVWIPPNGGGYYGRFTGSYVHVRIYDGYQWFKDTFQVHSLPLHVEDILKVSVKMLVGKIYVYGRAKTALITNGTLFEGPQIGITSGGLYWYFTEYSNNPVTGLPWTVAEVNALEAGLYLAHAGTFGMAICDQIKVEVTHRPVP